MIQKMGIMGNIFRYLPNSIYGYDIAVKDALSAILRYGTFQSLVVFYDPRQYQEHIIRKIIKPRLHSKIDQCQYVLRRVWVKP